MTREQAIAESWFRGNLTYKLHAGQRKIKADIDKSAGQLFVGHCSRQWGKSFMMVCRAIELAMTQKNARVKYGTAYLTDLAEFILPIFGQILEDCPASIRPKYKIQGSKWVFRNGSEIKLVGLDKNPNGLRGNAIDLIILDEASFMSKLKSLYVNVIIPATTHRPHCKVIMISTGPTTPAHDFAEYFIPKAEVESCYAKYTIYSNPRVDAATIARLMKESGGEESTTWKREYLCELVTDAGSRLVSEWKDEYIKPCTPDEYYRFYHLYEGMDLGVKHFTIVIFGYYDFRRATLVIQNEIKLNGPTLTTQVLRDAIEEKEFELWPETKPPEKGQPAERKIYRRISDNNNLHLIQDLAIMHRMSFIPTDKESLEAMLNEVRLMVAKGQIEVDPKCKQLVGCLKYGVWDKKKTKFAESEVYGHFDALAALIYLVRNLDKHANPIPHTYGFDPRNARIKSQANQSEGAKLANAIFRKPTQKR